MEAELTRNRRSAVRAERIASVATHRNRYARRFSTNGHCDDDIADSTAVANTSSADDGPTSAVANRISSSACLR